MCLFNERGRSAAVVGGDKDCGEWSLEWQRNGGRSVMAKGGSWMLGGGEVELGSRTELGRSETRDYISGPAQSLRVAVRLLCLHRRWRDIYPDSDSDSDSDPNTPLPPHPPSPSSPPAAMASGGDARFFARVRPVPLSRSLLSQCQSQCQCLF